MKQNNFVDKILGSIGLTRAVNIPLASGVNGADPFAIFSSSNGKIPAEKAMGANTGWTYAAVRAIAEEVAKIKFRLFKVGKNGDEEIFDHELLDLLDSVNQHQTRFELLYNTAAHLELAGNSYWLMFGANGEPVNQGATA